MLDLDIIFNLFYFDTNVRLLAICKPFPQN